MADKAIVEIDCDAETISVLSDPATSVFVSQPIDTTKASLIAAILCIQSRELMSMSKQELMARQLVML